MSRFLLVLGFTFTTLSAAAHAEYVGELQFTPSGCETTRDCTLVYDFGYIDKNKIGWVTVAGDKTDGASIPTWAQHFIGKPFDKLFIKAAVLHDHYCNRHVRPASQTHRMFYRALLESGVPKLKSKLMYYAVVVGAKPWIQLIPGKKCTVGSICIQNSGTTPDLHGGTIETTASGDKYLVKGDSYNDPGFDADLREVEKILAKRGNALSADDIVALARKRHPNDFFLNAGDSILYEDTQSKYPTE